MGANRQHRRARAMELLLGGSTHAEVAADLGVRRETVWRWTQDAGFATDLARARDERRRQAIGELDEAALDAVRCLRSLTSDKGVPAGVRVRAATAILDRVRPLSVRPTTPIQSESLLLRVRERALRSGLLGSASEPDLPEA